MSMPTQPVGRIRLAMIQQAYVPFDRDANMAKAEPAIRDAAAQGAEIVCLPEMFLTGYPGPSATDGEAWEAFVARMRETAEPPDGPYARRLAALAGKLGVHLVAGACERRDGKLYNSAFFFGPDGRHIGTYSKVHVCRFSKMEDLCDDGDNWRVWPVEIGGRTVHVGIMICYDREHPESARVLMLKGAELIIVPNACDIEWKRMSQLQIRAFENVVPIAMANHGKPHNGQSVIIDFHGDVVARAGEDETVVVGDIDIDALREERTKTIWGNHYRRPDRYGLIVAPNA